MATRVSFRTILSFWGQHLGSIARVGVIWAVLWVLYVALHLAPYLALMTFVPNSWLNGQNAGRLALLSIVYILVSLPSAALSASAWAILEGFGLGLVDSLHQQPPEATRADFKRAKSNTWSLAKCGMLVMIIIYAFAFILGFAIGSISGGSEWICVLLGVENSGVNAAIVTVTHVAVIVSAVFITVKLLLDYSLAPSFVMDGSGAVASLKLSKDAVKGHRLYILRLQAYAFVLITLPIALSGFVFPPMWALLVLAAPLHHVICPFVYRSLLPSTYQKVSGEFDPLLKVPA